MQGAQFARKKFLVSRWIKHPVAVRREMTIRFVPDLTGRPEQISTQPMD
jgi:hypothetical protein